MSAFICSDKTYSRIYSGLKLLGESYGTIAFVQPLLEWTLEKKPEGNPLKNLLLELYALNVEAVNQRYNESTSTAMDSIAHKAAFHFNEDISPFQFLKSLECLCYQMSIGTVQTEKPYLLIKTLINEVAEEIYKNMYSSFSIDDLLATVAKDEIPRAIVHSMPLYNAAKWD